MEAGREGADERSGGGLRGETSGTQSQKLTVNHCLCPGGDQGSICGHKKAASPSYSSPASPPVLHTQRGPKGMGIERPAGEKLEGEEAESEGQCGEVGAERAERREHSSETAQEGTACTQRLGKHVLGPGGGCQGLGCGGE